MLNREMPVDSAPFEQSAEAVFVLDQAGNFKRANASFAHLLGCAPRNCRARHFCSTSLRARRSGASSTSPGPPRAKLCATKPA
ncbi:PAS domain-containing protein [Hymenobacter humi]|uniref:PAS domain-containing protein n=1 Tax=Hymenobacter humi TaxID=1411620 RepID=A0ABW2TZP2_9BACT